MKHKFTTIIMALAGMWAALATQANATTFNFQENGPGDLGATSTFTEDGFSLTASGFLTSGGTTNLFSKNLGAGEIGLGTTTDPSGQHEIVFTNFVQLTLPTTPPSNFQLVIGGSVTNGETMQVFFTTTAGTLTGATLIGTISSTGGTLAIPAGDQTGFIDITAGKAGDNVLLASAEFSTTVPDGGSTVAFLGMALAGLEGVRRMVRGRKA
jgi:hypothetical protein